MSQPYPPAQPSDAVPNYLVIAILSVLCFWPVAIPAIIFATQVNKKIAAGDLEGAQASSKKAKMYSFIAIGLGVLGWVLGIIICIVFFGLFAAASR